MSECEHPFDHVAQLQPNISWCALCGALRSPTQVEVGGELEDTVDWKAPTNARQKYRSATEASILEEQDYQRWLDNNIRWAELARRVAKLEELARTPFFRVRHHQRPAE
jgi:hypothetical protein